MTLTKGTLHFLAAAVVIGIATLVSLPAQAGGQTFAGCSTDGTALGRDPFTGLVGPAPQFNNLCGGSGHGAMNPNDDSDDEDEIDEWWLIEQITIPYIYWGVPGANPAAGYLGGPVKLSMHTAGGADGIYADGGVSSTHNSGYSVSDSAGTIAAGSLAPGFHDFRSGGGISALVDGSRFFGFSGDQSLIFGLNLDFTNSQMDFGTSALTPGVANAAAINRDTYTVSGSARYTSGLFYLSGVAAFDWSHADITNNLDSGTGNTDGHGYAVRGSVGRVFPLFNTTGVNPAMPTKAPPAPRSGGYAVFLDVSGNLGYRNEMDAGFTDTTGFAFGTEQYSYTDLGAKAKLVVVIPTSGYAWMPYFGVTIDQQLGFSHTLDVVTTADTFNFGQSNTYWGLQAGVNLLNVGSATLGARAFYQASADTNTIGGSVFFKIPLWQPPARDSGIRTATK
jgi:hypothetical protein